MRLAAIVLAAGRGERFGGGKMQAEFIGRPLLDHAVEIALASPAEQVVVVGRRGATVGRKPGVTLVELASDSLANSLRAGLAAAGEVDGAFIFLGDMPLVPKDVADRLVAAIGPAIAAVPTFEDRPGHPVLLAREAFPLAETLSGDKGLGGMLRQRADVVRMAVSEPGVVTDVDFRADLVALQQSLEL